MMNNAKIKDLLNIDPVTKKIHLHDKRIVLMETDALGELRKDLISALGMDRAKGFLLRYGWNCGSNYAKIFKTVMPLTPIETGCMPGLKSMRLLVR